MAAREPNLVLENWIRARLEIAVLVLFFILVLSEGIRVFLLHLVVFNLLNLLALFDFDLFYQKDQSQLEFIDSFKKQRGPSSGLASVTQINSRLPRDFFHFQVPLERTGHTAVSDAGKIEQRQHSQWPHRDRNVVVHAEVRIGEDVEVEHVFTGLWRGCELQLNLCVVM